jgi:hypothetical protein
VNAQAFHIQVIFKVIKAIFNDIFVTVNSQSFCGIFYLVGEKAEESAVPFPVLLNFFIVKINP